ncbi:ganglioside GM2 activator-like [Tubulanus polymorphus]|uniref:ganglioside GM2 activator-like n=1 Tax=Tubulanus polymorphus TaxID=672921 RepID=UPI003DA58212
MLNYIVIGLLVGFANAGMYVKNCDGSQNKLIDFTKVSLTPHPIKFPGRLNIDALATVNREIGGQIDVKVSLKRKVWFAWVPIPCIKEIGSCEYKDICSRLKQFSCPPEVVEQGIQCHCPFKKGPMSFNMDNIILPSIPTGLGLLADGRFYAKAHIMADGVEIGCIEAEVELES